MSMLSRFPTTATAGIQYVGGTTAQITGSTATTTNVSLTGLTEGLASAPVTGDFVVVYYGVGSTVARTLSISTIGYATVVNTFVNDTYDANLLAAYKVMGAVPDTQVTVSATGATADSGAVAVQVWRYVDPYLPISTASTIATGTNSVLCDPPAITPATAGAMIIAGGSGGHARGVATYSSSDLRNFITVGGPDNTNDVTVGMGSRAGVSGTAFNPAAFTFSAADSAQYSWVAATLALRPIGTQPGPIAIAKAFTQNGSSGTSLVINKPTGTREGDLMVAFIASGGGTQSAPGWSGDTGWTYVANSTTGRPINAIAYKVAGASEGASYTFTSTNNRTAAGTIVTYRNAAYDTVGTFTSGTDPLVLPQVTLSADFSLLIGIAGRDAATITITAPAGMLTVDIDNGGAAPSYLIAQEGPEFSGATGTRSFTVGSTTNVNGLMMGIKPAASYTKYANYIASTSATGSGVASLAVNTPTCVPGNLLLFAVTVGISTATDITVSTPSGWTLLSGNSTNTTAYQPGMYIFYRVVDGTEATSYTATPSTTAAMCGSIVSLAGVNALTLTAGTTNTGSATTLIQANSVTATTNGILLYFGCQANNNQGPPTFTPPSGMTEAVEAQQDGAGIDSTLEVAYQEGLTAGATSFKVATSSSSAGTNRYRAILVTVGAL